MLLNVLFSLLRLNQCANVRFLSSGMLYHVGLEVVNNVSVEFPASIFLCTEYITLRRRYLSTKQIVSKCLTIFSLAYLFYPQDESGYGSKGPG
jgi:hypothetical protein